MSIKFLVIRRALNQYSGSFDKALPNPGTTNSYSIQILGYEVQYHQNSWYFDSQVGNSSNISNESLMFGPDTVANFQYNLKYPSPPAPAVASASSGVLAQAVASFGVQSGAPNLVSSMINQDPNTPSGVNLTSNPALRA